MEAAMKRISLLTLLFAVLSLVFISLLVFVRSRFPLYPLVSYQDVLDILTPLVLIPIYWLMFKFAVNDRPGLAEEIAFVVLAAIWVEGHGVHLAANSIDNLIDALARNPATDVKGSDVYRLVFFFDERLGHYVWHLGMLGLAALLIYLERYHAVESVTNWWSSIAAGIVYGFTYFCIFIQARTVFMGLPFAIMVVLAALLLDRKKLPLRPLLAFFFVASLVAVLLIGGWWLYWGGLPQFTTVGLI
jgi:hypothetical protein